jgi:ribosomal L31-like protein
VAGVELISIEGTTTTSSSSIIFVHSLNHNVRTVPSNKSAQRRAIMVRIAHSHSPHPSLTSPRRKIPWRLSPPQKARQRARLRHVDKIVSIVDQALSKQGVKTKAVERWKTEMPTEAEMMPRDKYTMFVRYGKNYRKGIHSKSSFWGRCWILELEWFLLTALITELPKWTRVSQRLNPPGF